VEILGRLEQLKEDHRDERGELSYESHTCLQAAAIIKGLDDRVRTMEHEKRQTTLPLAVFWLAVATIGNGVAVITLELVRMNCHR
jgi:hypothetical protein